MKASSVICIVLGVVVSVGCADRLNERQARRAASVRAVEVKLTPDVRRMILKEAQEWLRVAGTNEVTVSASSYGKDLLPTSCSIGEPLLVPRWNEMMIRVRFQNGIMDVWYVTVFAELDGSCAKVGTEPQGRFTLQIAERDWRQR